jgi:hypothetical protein
MNLMMICIIGRVLKYIVGIFGPIGGIRRECEGRGQARTKSNIATATEELYKLPAAEIWLVTVSLKVMSGLRIRAIFEAWKQITASGDSNISVLSKFSKLAP